MPYDPGPLPQRSAPTAGPQLVLEIKGLPPRKEVSRSIRNPDHHRYQSFVDLRNAAVKEMDGRAWTRGAVELNIEVRCPDSPGAKRLSEFLGGILDTLDGSHGFTFTYPPIVFEDDCQVVATKICHLSSKAKSYRLEIRFID